jgi:hypothetical protein
VYQRVDCDNDGLLDHVCTDTADRNVRSVVLAGQPYCDVFNPESADPSLCPRAFSGMYGLSCGPARPGPALPPFRPFRPGRLASRQPPRRQPVQRHVRIQRVLQLHHEQLPVPAGVHG